MIRKIIQVDESLCDGCGDCVLSCPNRALAMVGDKVKLIRDALCDATGACIGDCLTGALRIIEREGGDYDIVAALHHLAIQKNQEHTP